MSDDPLKSAKSMFPSAWRQARERVLAAAPPAPGERRLLLELVDAAGASLGRLQALFDRNPEPFGADSEWVHLFHFINDDLSDIFRTVAIGSSVLLRADELPDEADPTEVAADAELLVRYLAVALLAAEHPMAPREIREMFRIVGRDMEGWGGRITGEIRRIADQLPSREWRA